MSMQLLASDNFVRANQNPLAGNWTKQVGAQTLDNQLISNSIAITTTMQQCVDYWNAISWPNDQWSEIKVNSLTANTRYLYAVVRASLAGQNSYEAVVQGPLGSSAVLYLQKRTAGVGANFTSVTTPVNAGDLLRISAQGTTLTAYINGVQKLQVTDSLFASGNAGIGLFSDSAVLSDCTLNGWSGGAVISGARTLVGTGV